MFLFLLLLLAVCAAQCSFQNTGFQTTLQYPSSDVNCSGFPTAIETVRITGSCFECVGQCYGQRTVCAPSVNVTIPNGCGFELYQGTSCSANGQNNTIFKVTYQVGACIRTYQGSAFQAPGFTSVANYRSWMVLSCRNSQTSGAPLDIQAFVDSNCLYPIDQDFVPSPPATPSNACSGCTYPSAFSPVYSSVSFCSTVGKRLLFFRLLSNS